jgi:hypothetical protein
MFRMALLSSAFLIGVSAAAFAQPAPNADKTPEAKMNGNNSQLSLSEAQRVHTGRESGPHKMSQARGPQKSESTTGVKPELQSSTPGAQVAAGR